MAGGATTTSTSTYVDVSLLRERFAMAMSDMYKAEVPLYADLIDIVEGINKELMQSHNMVVSAKRLTAERHGAIRLGTVDELRTIKRLFRLLDMHPVGYYDLSAAGLPMHATAFRPTNQLSLPKSPFRVFTTLLRPELLASDDARKLARSLVSRRKLFSDELLKMLDVADTQAAQLTPEQSDVFIREALRTFSWHPVATSTLDEYNLLKKEHPILADIACFPTAHINHLTPRTLDIDRVQKTMQERGMKAKARIEGPPARKCAILLRQTSFLALEEKVSFHTTVGSETLVASTHTARFGEIEQRGAALTPIGRDLYDALLAESASKSAGLSPKEADAVKQKVFEQFPDTWEELRAEDLIYSYYRAVKKPAHRPEVTGGRRNLLEQLVHEGYIEVQPITYEDFLPISAAGIFHSNLAGTKSGGPKLKAIGPDREGLEQALGMDLEDQYEWYDRIQTVSLEFVSDEIGLTVASMLS